MSKCIITGCALVQHTGEWAWGDLFEVGDCYAFLAVPESGDVWNYSPCSSTKQLRLDPVNNWFQQRNVIVVPRAHAELSVEAKAYVEQWR